MFILCFLLALSSIEVTYQTPLDDYVNTPDPHYNYSVIHIYELTGLKMFIINMTSQKWQDETIVDRPIWWHYVCVAVPDNITRPDASLLWIGGWNNNPTIPDANEEELRMISAYAVGTGTIATFLRNVPNQPLVFQKDPKKDRRYEDAIIAWTWSEFLKNTSNPNILLRLPMTKAAVRAMDTIQSFAKENNFGEVKKFMVTGESKRGWTTWTTAAVDTERVFSAVPIVMDMLNLNPNFHNHFRSLGGWTVQFDDYYKLNITNYVDSQQLFEMMAIVDPYSYLDRYKKTNILVVVTSGDEFFLGDDTKAYWEDLVAATDGRVLLKRIPNAEHELIGHQLNELYTLMGFFLSTYENQMIPNLKWSMPNNMTHGIIRANIDFSKSPKPFNVRAYYAHTLGNKRRDFRVIIGDPNNPGQMIPNPVIWLKTESTIEKFENDTMGVYEVAFLKPVYGWFAFFLEFSFKGVDFTTNTVTTETNIIPEIYPFDDCTLTSCHGTLV